MESAFCYPDHSSKWSNTSPQGSCRGVLSGYASRFSGSWDEETTLLTSFLSSTSCPNVGCSLPSRAGPGQGCAWPSPLELSPRLRVSGDLGERPTVSQGADVRALEPEASRSLSCLKVTAPPRVPQPWLGTRSPTQKAGPRALRSSLVAQTQGS